MSVKIESVIVTGSLTGIITNTTTESTQGIAVGRVSAIITVSSKIVVLIPVYGSSNSVPKQIYS